MSLVGEMIKSSRRMIEYQETGCSREWMQTLETDDVAMPDDMPEPAAGVMSPPPFSASLDPALQSTKPKLLPWFCRVLRHSAGQENRGGGIFNSSLCPRDARLHIAFADD